MFSVLQITPAAGLVSILKRRVSLEGANSSVPAPPKPFSKRKVRFREPDEGLDHGKNPNQISVILFEMSL